MDNDEDLFNMLDGINQSTQEMRRNASNYDLYNTQPVRQQQNPDQFYGSQYAPERDLFEPDLVPQYQQQREEHDMFTRRVAAGQAQDNALFGSSDDGYQYRQYDPSPTTGGQLMQYAYQTTSPAPEAASSPAFRASQRRNEYPMSQVPLARTRAREPADPQYDEPQVRAPEPARPQYEASRRPEAAMGPPKKPDFLSTHALPDRFRSVFPYPNFNAMQTQCFDTVYKSNDNFVLSSPTGSGKTAIFELGICRVINSFPAGQFKIVYQAPTKSLCAERQRDWQKKFRIFQMEVAELTGDTDPAQIRHVQAASIIITTPEKWDSITRKWKDHEKLMSLIKLFLIDEVHMLHDMRGATLEAVVSRMKSVHFEVRFIALSATVPNSHDIATWLGRNHDRQDLPAREQRFGEEFRPVLLQKHVVGYHCGGNDFSFENVLNTKLPEVIAQYSHRKPIMIFCMTRKICESTAQMLAKWWSSMNANNQYWRAPRQIVKVDDKNLSNCTPTGIAWHHAGLLLADRSAVEQGFLNGDISVICCTSTLAVGVNLPCHMVILKNTVNYIHGEGVKEYSDLEIMQMLGRAGRPQFDTSGVAVIMTRHEKARRYGRMVSGKQILESCLHENLIDHLNAEIGLGTVTNLASAKKWLSSTFLYVRLKANPGHYKLDDGTGESNLDARLENICCRDIEQLRDAELITGETKLDTTPNGETMARLSVKFETAKVFLSLHRGATLSEILSVLCLAAEWQDIRFRGSEKATYKHLNKSPQIRFPIPVHLDTTAHKVSLIIQSQLGGANLPVTEKTQPNTLQYNQDVGLIFQHLRRLINCIIDFKREAGDSVSLRNALFMCRSIGARCWDDWPQVLKQLDKIGPAGALKLVNAGIKGIEALENTEPHRIEAVLKRQTPFGHQIVAAARAFPRLRVMASIVGKPTFKAGKGAKIKVDAEIGFLNDSPVLTFANHPVFLVFFAETSDGQCVHFAKANAKQIGKGQKVTFSVNLINSHQVVICHVMCGEIAGTCTSVTIKPTVPSIAWPKEQEEVETPPRDRAPEHAMNISKKRSPSQALLRKKSSDEFGDNLLDEEDLYGALEGIEQEEDEFRDIDAFDLLSKKQLPLQNAASTSSRFTGRTTQQESAEAEYLWQPTQLENGRWACNHRCKDKEHCQHECCKEGHDRPPRPPKKSVKVKDDSGGSTSKPKPKLQKGQKTLEIRQPLQRVRVASMDNDIEFMDLSYEKPKPVKAPEAPGFKRLDQLHASTQKTPTSKITSLMRQSSTHPASHGASQQLSFLPLHRQPQEHKDESTDYGPEILDFELPDDPVEPTAEERFEKDAAMVAEFTGTQPAKSRLLDLTSTNNGFGESDSLLEEALVGLADSQSIQKSAIPRDSRFKDTALPSTIEVDHFASDTQISRPSKSTGLTAPFFQSSSGSSMDFAKLVAKRRPLSETNDNIPATKRLRTDASEQTGATAMTRSKELKPEEVVAKRAEEEEAADKSSDPASEVDPMILQMFGSYVDFV